MKMTSRGWKGASVASPREMWGSMNAQVLWDWHFDSPLKRIPSIKFKGKVCQKSDTSWQIQVVDSNDGVFSLTILDNNFIIFYSTRWSSLSLQIPRDTWAGNVLPAAEASWKTMAHEAWEGILAHVKRGFVLNTRPSYTQIKYITASN